MLNQNQTSLFRQCPRAFGVIYCTVVTGDLADVVQTNRGALSVCECLSSTHINSIHIPIIFFYICFHAGVTLGSSAIRRRPNAFNLLHQMELMCRGGYSADTSLEKLQAPSHSKKQTQTILQGIPVEKLQAPNGYHSPGYSMVFQGSQLTSGHGECGSLCGGLSGWSNRSWCGHQPFPHGFR